MEPDTLEKEDFKNVYSVTYKAHATFEGLGFANTEEALREDLLEQFKDMPGFEILTVNLLGTKDELQMQMAEPASEAIN